MIEPSTSAFLYSTVLTAFAEMGDKTQLISILLAAKYRKPLPIILGIIIAIFLNHTMAIWLGKTIAASTGCGWMTWVISFLFIGIGLWILEPDKIGNVEIKKDYGVFLTTIITFFLAEMGDKTQIAATALGGEYKQIMPVLNGTVTGILLANIPFVLFGNKLYDKIPIKLLNYITAAIFIWFGISRIITFN